LEKTPKWPNVPDEQKLDPQVIDLEEKLRTQSAPLTSIKYRFNWAKVNDVTFKLTDGELTNVPRSHGQWGGYRTTKAVAWVICIHPGRWLARFRNTVCGPSSLTKAKKAAMALVKGSFGDYCIANPIAHLNGLAARLTDSETDPLSAEAEKLTHKDGLNET
jgi:hypothetical protein